MGMLYRSENQNGWFPDATDLEDSTGGPVGVPFNQFRNPTLENRDSLGYWIALDLREVYVVDAVLTQATSLGRVEAWKICLGVDDVIDSGSGSCVYEGPSFVPGSTVQQNEPYDPYNGTRQIGVTTFNAPSRARFVTFYMQVYSGVPSARVGVRGYPEDPNVNNTGLTRGLWRSNDTIARTSTRVGFDASLPGAVPFGAIVPDGTTGGAVKCEDITDRCTCCRARQLGAFNPWQCEAPLTQASLAQFAREDNECNNNRCVWRSPSPDWPQGGCMAENRAWTEFVATSPPLELHTFFGEASCMLGASCR
jgi:hypothetical protein